MLQKHLEQQGVMFDSCHALQLVDVHDYNDMLKLQIGPKTFTATLDAVAVPYGVMSYNMKMRLAVKLVHTEEDKQLYEQSA